MKLRHEIVVLEEKNKNLNIKLFHTIKKFEYLTNSNNIKKLARNYKITLKDMENIKLYRNTKDVIPLVKKNDSKKP